MIPRHLHARTYRSFADELGVMVCDGKGRCRKRWSAFKHSRPNIDPMGYIHWASIDNRINRPGITTFLIMCAIATNPDLEKLPRWERLYEACRIGQQIGMHYFRIKLLDQDMQRYRRKVKQLAVADGVTLRRHHQKAFAWANYEHVKMNQWRYNQGKVSKLTKEVARGR